MKTSRPRLLLSVLLGIFAPATRAALALLFPVALFSQTPATAPSAPGAATEPAVVLSPFQVEASTDQG